MSDLSHELTLSAISSGTGLGVEHVLNEVLRVIALSQPDAARAIAASLTKYASTARGTTNADPYMALVVKTMVSTIESAAGTLMGTRSV